MARQRWQEARHVPRSVRQWIASCFATLLQCTTPTAGANAGMATVMFKLLFPNATIVSLEPDPGNYAALKRNTQQ